MRGKHGIAFFVLKVPFSPYQSMSFSVWLSSIVVIVLHLQSRSLVYSWTLPPCYADYCFTQAAHVYVMRSVKIRLMSPKFEN